MASVGVIHIASTVQQLFMSNISIIFMSTIINNGLFEVNQRGGLVIRSEPIYIYIYIYIYFPPSHLDTLGLIRTEIQKFAESFDENYVIY
jgi:hypothetical protein